ncbi:hypothetical protein BSL78_00483 [Apostichopus japonicus]|uniref:Uncharacterized protein n=1 Tax=Stichopus japonicus TaxID=307972 RepID=A0A2G8LQN9_STIJA|nr:hypothetical protein BSL78_00483 [Apostichopus japonicus]
MKCLVKFRSSTHTAERTTARRSDTRCTLDLLDELLEAHATIAPFSLFAESVKRSIRVTAKELMKLLLLQRETGSEEYDFILVSPMKKRMLLKMYALGVFMNGRDLGRERQTFQSETVQRLYNPKTSVVLQHRQVQGDDGNYVNFNVEDDEIPNNYKRQQQLREAGLILTGIQEEEEHDDDDAIDDEPGSIRYTDSDLVSSINDQDMEDLREMMAGIPSRPGTGVSSSKNSLDPTSSGTLSATSRKSTDLKGADNGESQA